MTTPELLAECHAVLTGCSCNRCDVCRVRRMIASHALAAQLDADTLRRWYQTLPADAVRSLVTARTVRSEARL